MKKYIQHIAPKIGFGRAILLFIGLNFYSLCANYGGCIDCYGDFGIPFTLADSNFMYMEFIWTGVIADFIFALICSYVIGLVYKSIRAKFTAKKLL
jgi:hypothetical protein